MELLLKLKLLKMIFLFQERLKENTSRTLSFLLFKDNFSRCLTLTAIDEKGALWRLSHKNTMYVPFKFHPDTLVVKQLLKLVGKLKKENETDINRIIRTEKSF